MLFQGCIPQNNITVAKQNIEPNWLLDPYIDGDKIAAVGCAQKHFKGIAAQKDLAIARAIDRIATQNSVIVDNITARKKSSLKGRRGTSSSTSSSLHTVKNVQISTKTKSLYTKQNHEICAWVIQR